MVSEFKFKEVRAYLEKKDGAEIIDAFDQLADVALLFTPIVFGIQFSPILELLDIKDRLFNLGRSVVSFIAKQTEPTYVERVEQIKFAYGMIGFTAYFEALCELFPKDTITELIGQFKEMYIENENITDNTLPHGKWSSEQYQRKIPLTDEVMSIDDVKKSLLAFYNETTERLIINISKSIFKDESKKNEQKKQKIKEALKKIPDLAILYYEAQYIELATSFDDFGMFVQLKEFESINNQNQDNYQVVCQILEKIDNLDIGLTTLSLALDKINAQSYVSETQDIINELQITYKSEIEKPIISDKEDEKRITNNNERRNLSFPRVVDAFIPQSYKCLTYDEYSDVKSLEDVNLWKHLPAHEHIHTFFIKYLNSPSSIDYPLIVIGHPGSGKSVLTKILAAQIMCNAYTVIRIPLRDVNADDDIAVLVEKQIKKDTSRPLNNGYAGFAQNFVERPLLIILDGYDELLQAKGQVFSGYLSKVHLFQQDQKVHGRPIRVMVTSRITLIDKATIPNNSTILRLLEFDQNRRETWIDKWNETNADYFKRENIKPFALPKERQMKSSLKELAEQPLLLLMLAIYDSEKNELKDLGNSLKRTDLYDDLLRRFCRRESNRYNGEFENSKEEAALEKQYIENDMMRLGVVSIGMFNRRELLVHSKELLLDLEIYNMKREQRGSLKDADSLIGNFFFVHKSEARDGSDDAKESEVAYEFLHATFGEFLTADFILRFIIQEALALSEMSRSNRMANKVDQMLYAPDGLCNEWFINLMFTPLYSRPVVVEMIREHLPRMLEREMIDMQIFVDNFILIVETQLKMFLENKELPLIMSKIDNFQNIPLLGHISTYTMNLVILAALISETGFVFKETDYGSDYSQDSETRPWDKLTYLWKTWFSSDNLTGLSAVIKAERNDSNITIKCYERFEFDKDMNKIEVQLSIAAALSDDLLMGLSGLQTSRFCDIAKMKESDIVNLLEKVDTNLYCSYIAILIRREINHFSYERIDFSTINKLVEKIINCKKFIYLNIDVVATAFEVIEIALLRRMLYIENQKRLILFVNQIFNEYGEYRDNGHFLESLNHIIYIISTTLDPIMWLAEDSADHIPYREVERFWDKNMRYFYSDSKKKARYLHKRFVNPILYLRESTDLHWNNDEKFEIILKHFDEYDFFELLKTDPEFISRFVCVYPQKKGVRLKFIENYFSCLIKLIDTYGINYFAGAVIENSLQAAKIFKQKNYADEIMHYMYRTIQHNGTDYFAYLVINNPKVITLLSEYLSINGLNEFLESTSRHIDKYFDIEYKRGLISYHNRFVIFEYIEIYKQLSQRNYDNLLTDFIIKLIHYNLKDFSRKSMCSLRETVSILQYNNLVWYFEKTTDSEAHYLINLIDDESSQFTTKI